MASRSGYTGRDDRFELDLASLASLASGRYLQVVTNGGASWAALGDGYGRSNWVDPAPQGAAVPEPASLGLSLVALAALLRRRRPAG